MKKTLLFSILLLASTSFAQKRNEIPIQAAAPVAEQSFISRESFEGFIPQSPVIYTGSLPVWGGKEGSTQEPMLSLVVKQDLLKRILPDFSIDYYIRKINQDGKATYGISGVTGAPGNYEIIYDITKSTTVPLTGDAITNQSSSNFVKVGVGIRIKANITTSQANIDVSNLDHLAQAVEAEKLRGGLSFMLFGIDGAAMIAISPNSNAKIDASSIDTFMQSVAILKSRMYDENVTLVPRVFSVQYNTGGMPMSLLGMK